jgi:hypothetical protein
MLKEECPAADEIHRLRREYEVTRKLDLNVIVRTLGMEEFKNRSALGNHIMGAFVKTVGMGRPKALHIH